VLTRLRYRPGDFIMAGRILADVAPARVVNDELGDAVRGCFKDMLDRAMSPVRAKSH